VTGRWRSRAACKTADPDLFFPEIGGNAAAARAICAACPVAAECLAYAVSVPERHGVFGGLSEEERRGMRPPGLCRSGQHLMSPGNTYTEPASGARRCNACRVEARRRRHKTAVPSLAPQPRKAAA
jgi:WhiB family transcriptional regulator, redox-sensing transcriptional regulator